MIYHSSEKRADYTMPLLGNGELCIRVSHKGTMDKLTSVAEKYCLPTNYIW